MIDWLIRYDDGSTYTNEQGEPWEAPRSGVMRVYYADVATGVSIEPSPIGHWIWRGGRWVGLDDLSGFYDYLMHSGTPCVVLFGRTLPNEEWDDFVAAEAQFMVGAEKSAWRKRERRR